MSQDHLVIDFPIRGPANAKALNDELPSLMPDFAKGAGRPWYRALLWCFMIRGDEKLLFPLRRRR